MPTKTTGAEFKRFYNDAAWWPQDDGNTYHEDETVTVNGAEHEGDYDTVPDNALVTVADGIVFGPQWDGNEPSFEAYFKRWRKAQTTVSFLVEVDASKADAVRAAIKAAGGKVI